MLSLDKIVELKKCIREEQHSKVPDLELIRLCKGVLAGTVQVIEGAFDPKALAADRPTLVKEDQHLDPATNESTPNKT